MEIDYTVELDYGDDALCVGEVVGVPPEFGKTVRLAPADQTTGSSTSGSTVLITRTRTTRT